MASKVTIKSKSSKSTKSTTTTSTAASFNATTDAIFKHYNTDYVMMNKFNYSNNNHRIIGSGGGGGVNNYQHQHNTTHHNSTRHHHNTNSSSRNSSNKNKNNTLGTSNSVGRKHMATTITPQLSPPVVTTNSKYLRQSFRTLAEKRQFYKIIDVLHKECPDRVRLWLQGRTNVSISCSNINTNNKLHSSNDTERIQQQREGGVSTPLHIICSVRPPAYLVSIIVHVLKMNGDFVPEDSIDENGMTPLHIAAAKNCDSNVIDILANGTDRSSYVTASFTRDSWRRYPLHWACCALSNNNNVEDMNQNQYKNILSNDNNNDCTSSSNVCMFNPANTILKMVICNNQKQQHNIIRIIRLLVDVYPAAASLRDVDGKTPLDIAMQYQADGCIIDILQDTIFRYNKNKEKRHDHIVDSRIWKNEEMTESITEDPTNSAFPEGFPSSIKLMTSKEQRDLKKHRRMKFEC